MVDKSEAKWTFGRKWFYKAIGDGQFFICRKAGQNDHMTVSVGTVMTEAVADMIVQLYNEFVVTRGKTAGRRVIKVNACAINECPYFWWKEDVESGFCTLMAYKGKSLFRIPKGHDAWSGSFPKFCPLEKEDE